MILNCINALTSFLKFILILLIAFDVADNMKFSELLLFSFSSFRKLFNIDNAVILPLRMNVFFF